MNSATAFLELPQSDDRADDALNAALDALRERLGEAITLQHTLRQRRAALASAPARTERAAEAALAAGRDEFARAAVAAKLEAADISREIEARLSALADDIAALEALITEGSQPPGDAKALRQRLERTMALIDALDTRHDTEGRS